MERQDVDPDYAARKFADDSRRRAHRGNCVLQLRYNTADSTKLQALCGFRCLRYNAGENRIFWVNGKPGKIVANYLIILEKSFFYAFEVRNLGLKINRRYAPD